MRRQFDRIVVVTAPHDEGTKDLCHRLNLEMIVTADFYTNGTDFNKGRGVERGLAMLGHEDWVFHLDADIYLPDDFRESLLDAQPDPSTLYGADRLIVYGWEQFIKIRDQGSTRSWHCYQSTGQFQIGARWVDIRYGYVPIGYFQMWNSAHDMRKGIRTRRYPDHHNNAARADVQFALQWDRPKRQVIPEVLVAHIEPKPQPMGQNWKGRKTNPVQFGPRPLPSSQACPPAWNYWGSGRP